MSSQSTEERWGPFAKPQPGFYSALEYGGSIYLEETAPLDQPLPRPWSELQLYS